MGGFMINMERYRWLEVQLNRDNLTDEEFNVYNKEINTIQIEINIIKAERKAFREQKIKEQQEELELQKILSLTEEQVDKMYEDSCLKYQDVNGMSFKEWYAQSLKYYTVDVMFNVHARARSEDTVEVIAHISLAQAKLTILMRIKYKFYDHAVRGHDFAWNIKAV